jgi:hypothetical protein
MTYYWIRFSLAIIKECEEKFYAIDQQAILLKNEKTLF